MRRCVGCGAPVDAGSGTQVCGRCGAPIVPDDDVTRPIPTAWGGAGSAAPVVAAADRPCLLVLRGPNVGSLWTTRAGMTTIGRHPASDVFLNDVSVSRRHAVVERAGDGVWVADSGSLNGTYLNGERIDGREGMRSGDRLQIGRFRMVFIA
jgi:pSer/pThr/pTyr-binding forkhead associated (FHA) protein